MWLRLISCEQMKLKKSMIWGASICIPLMINILLAIDLQFRYKGYLLVHQNELGLSSWQLVWKEQRILYYPALLPLLAAVMMIQIFSTEDKTNGWTLLFLQPVKKYRVFIAKYIVCCECISVMAAVNGITLAAAGFAAGVEGQPAYQLFLRCLIIQLASTFAVAALHLAVYVVTKSKGLSMLIAFLFGVLSQNSYQQGGIRQYNPYSYADFSYLADWNQAFSMLLLSVLFIMTGTLISTLFSHNIEKNIFKE